ncbi:MAG: phospho-N-acetylmuramoyl-pentapeptide-transferase [Thermotogota bacterium]
MSWIFLIEGIITILIYKYSIPLYKRWGIVQYVREEGPRLHNYKQGTPTAGGVVFLLVFIAFYTLSQWFSASSFYYPVLLTAVLFGLIGFTDDFLCVRRKNAKGLPARAKLIAQLAVSLIVYFFSHHGIRSTTISLVPISRTIDLGWFYPVFFVLYLTAFSNSANLTDGLDGLSGGNALISALGAQIFLFLVGVKDYSMIFLAGALIGFLWFNVKPASIFMGDAGSLSIGALLGIIPLLTGYSLFFVFLCLIYSLELLSVVLQVGSFKLFHRKIFLMSPIHHHFELLGWKESTIVLRFWALNFLGVILALSFVII